MQELNSWNDELEGSIREANLIDPKGMVDVEKFVRWPFEGETGMEPQIEEVILLLSLFDSYCKEEKHREATQLLSVDAVCRLADGTNIYGREDIFKFYEQQRENGHRVLMERGWKLLASGGESHTNYVVADRIIREMSPVGLFGACSCTQQVSIEGGSIIKVKNMRNNVPGWEAGLTPLDLLRRFGGLRELGRDEDALQFLGEKAGWARLNDVALFDANGFGTVLVGRDDIAKLWAEMRTQGIIQNALVDWAQTDGFSYKRKLVVAREGMKRFVVQTATVAGGFIASMRSDMDAA
eukprot:TRINITY_DN56910_c0_g1_i1.p1 TRINITY_DN56910_c0_g1~~TRINITY_DN56910_c0_g1_i1.p1  ORF type:complete len:337 (+),score=51.13 TRINITY_DN56910_c0_g1_i1:129-1013(+)